MRPFLLALALCLTTSVAQAQVTTYPYDGSFDDAAFNLESAIIDRGLTIEYVSHVGDMLARTGKDVGSEVQIFDAADIYIFCSAVLSRKVMEADPMNIAHCPYGVFVTSIQGRVSVGYRSLPPGPMQSVQTLLDEIAREAVSD